ncbi:uncharacterized protein LOC113889150 [Bos indicus x Bos taurus]|uniref:uncharacterized protein LOC113888640 n=1 Tax=Bos indicus x Bos taurus TaxID=30522 RepID=UPI000F7D3F92|nr:uncharacterized protein LOC113888640 [Bos indicus x Bos taurus]XP_027391482.1 uncharacterized protein LOC113888640 [Bos indicus x Bos taurus]XP_027391483.1 uncharacterized protein LOC113888640 [Bos indicus x Bos taurus]XP_027391765.1 uncharacterized protein LOC113889150 [Bos indicus x Bos taurus]XP_027391766.1 uncharacterized protein LOC113889150 [Bos indicus x Bos taurus]XP_027391767.1 uncharacterized protein LOC113889150 [Bos indicus x Bos taurus]
MEPQGSLRTSVVPGTRASPPHSCRTLRQVARGLPRTDTHKGCLPVLSPDASRRLGHFREPDRPEGDGSWTCTRSSLPPEGLPRSSPCSAGRERSVRRLQAASLTRGQRCGQGTETGNERQTHTQSPIPRGLSHPRRSGRPSDRAQARSCTPSPHPLQRLPSRASPRELSRSGTSPSQVNTETPGTLPGVCPALSQEAASRPRPRGTRSSSELSVRHTGRAAHSVCLGVCTHVRQSRPTATAPETAAASCSSPWWLWPSRWHKGRCRRSSAPEAGCPCWDGRAARAPVGAACGFSLLRVWTGESRLRRQAGQTGPSAAPRPASVGCVLAGVATALSSSLRPLCPPGTPPTQELCRWRLLRLPGVCGVTPQEGL